MRIIIYQKWFNSSIFLPTILRCGVSWSCSLVSQQVLRVKILSYSRRIGMSKVLFTYLSSAGMCQPDPSYGFPGLRLMNDAEWVPAFAAHLKGKYAFSLRRILPRIKRCVSPRRGMSIHAQLRNDCARWVCLAPFVFSYCVGVQSTWLVAFTVFFHFMYANTTHFVTYIKQLKRSFLLRNAWISQVVLKKCSCLT